MIRTREAGTLAGRRRAARGRAGRLGGASTRPRWRGLHRPARRIRSRAGRDSRHRLPPTSCASEYCVKVVGEVALRPAGNENPELEYRCTSR